MNLKKALIILISISLMVSIAFAMYIFDVPTGWSRNAVENAIENKILSPEAGYIRPMDLLTRAEMAQGINNIFGTSKTADISGYMDVAPTSWYYNDMSKAVAMGLFSGYGNNLLKPEKNITREEMLTAIFNILEYEDGDVRVLEAFNDKSTIPAWSRKILARMVQEKYVSGNIKGNIKPSTPITREEFVQIINNIFTAYYNEEGTYNNIPQGNIIISSPNVTLKSATITKDLIITEGVNGGKIILDDIKVLGRILIRGTVNLQIKNDSKIINPIIVTEYASNSKIFGKSDVKEVLVNANDVTVSIEDAIVTAGKNTTKVKAGKKNVPAGTSLKVKATSSSGSSSSSKSESSSNSNSSSEVICNHNWTVTQKASCILPLVETCSLCNKTKTGNTLEHNWSTSQKVSCTTDEIQLCSNCGKTEKTKSKLGHDYDSSKICTRCNEFKSQLTHYIKNIDETIIYNYSFIETAYNELPSKNIKFASNLTPNGWIIIENNEITNYYLEYEDKIVTNCTGDNHIEVLNLEESISNTLRINVGDYGAIPNDDIDDTLAIQEAVKKVNEIGGILYFPEGHYLVYVAANKGSVIEINSSKNVIIDFNKASLKLASNPYPHYALVTVTNTPTAKVINGILIGDRQEHTYDPNVSYGPTHEWGYGIHAKRTDSTYIYDMEIYDMAGDTICLGTTKKTVIDNCNLHHARRQGISILESMENYVTNTHIHHIGDYDNIAGTAPRCGIDIEPDTGTFNAGKVLIQNCFIDEVSNFGIVMGKEYFCEDVKVIDSEIQSPSIAGNKDIYENCIINYKTPKATVLNGFVKDTTINVDYSDNNGHTIFVNNCDLTNCDILSSPSGNKSVIRFESNCSIQNCTFDGFVKDDVAPEIWNASNYGINIGSSIINENNTFINCDIMHLKDSDSYFENATITGGHIYSVEDLTINNSNIDKSKITIYSPFSLTNTKIYNTFMNVGWEIKEFKNSHIEADIYSAYDATAFPEGSSFDNTTIIIQGDTKRNLLKNVLLTNNCKIILEKYNDTIKMTNNKSILDVDYTIEYLGNETLN